MRTSYLAVMLMFGMASYAETTKINYTARTGIAPVATATITMSLTNSKYNIDFNGRGIGIAKVLGYKAKAKSKGVTGRATKPSWAQMWTSRRGKARDTIMTFNGLSPHVKITPHWQPGQKKEILNLEHIKGSIDPMATLVRLSNQMRLKNTCWGHFYVTDGRSAFRVTAKSGGQVNISTQAYKGKTQLCKIYAKALSGRVIREVKAGQIQTANIYFASFKGKNYPVPVKISGKFAGFGMALEARSVQ